jgi:hypothetical protein
MPAILESVLEPAAGDTLIELCDVGIEDNATFRQGGAMAKPVARQLGPRPRIAAAGG